MRMAELAERSGLPVATIKFYLREGLLPAGVSTSATQASYDDSHVRRLRLVRALIEVAGMRLDAVRSVLAAVDDESLSWHEAVGSAHSRLGAGTGPAPPAARDRVEALLARHSWTLSPASRHIDVLAKALDAIDAINGVDHTIGDELLDVYARAATMIAEHEVSAIDADDHVVATAQVVVGTLLLEPVLLAIRRIAQENVSQQTRDTAGS
jgi:DNA-binding transcriptional MerR regulator